MATADQRVVLRVVVSQGQSVHPDKRQLEEQLASAAAQIPGVSVVVVPHLYDLSYDGPVFSALRAIREPLAVFAWLYERATRWLLDRNGVRGTEGQTALRNVGEQDDLDDEDFSEDDAAAQDEEADEKTRVLEERPPPDRPIYCFDLRLRPTIEDFVAELRRIVEELQGRAATGPSALTASETADARSETVGVAAGEGNAPQPEQLLRWLQGTPRQDQVERFLEPHTGTPAGLVQKLQEAADRRWYPVIDYSRCTNCMECIDFCLFGVYGVDKQQTILVEQPDNCRKGCPACSRVCPENAIIFPQHKTPAIAGAPATVGGLKIDLSRLFGGDPLQLAVQERDEQLVLAGRDAVGMSVGIPKRQAHRRNEPADALDQLIDQLDSLDL